MGLLQEQFTVQTAWTPVPLGAGVECAVGHDMANAPVVPHPAELLMTTTTMVAPLCAAHARHAAGNMIGSVVAQRGSVPRASIKISDDGVHHNGVPYQVREDPNSPLVLWTESGPEPTEDYITSKMLIPARELEEGMYVYSMGDGWARVKPIGNDHYEDGIEKRVLFVEYNAQHGHKSVVLNADELVAVLSDTMAGEPWKGELS